VSGPTRALVWRIASECGLLGEIQGLQVKDLDLDGPALVVGASISKNRREVRQPILPELTRDLAPYARDNRRDTTPSVPVAFEQDAPGSSEREGSASIARRSSSARSRV